MNDAPPDAPIPMELVQSKTVTAAGYDPASRRLALRFQNGATYHYSGVDPEVHEQVKAAAADPQRSLGRELRTLVFGKYLATKQP